MIRPAALLATSALGLMAPALAQAGSPYDALIAQHAAANGVPVELVHRVIVRESRYNPRAVNSGNYGMMQIRLATARGLGYRGTAQGLLDPATNLTYAVKYLAGAYRVAGGNQGRAVSLYASGYYYAAKRQGLAPRGGQGISADAPVFNAAVAPTLQPAVLRGGQAFQQGMSESGASNVALAGAAAPRATRTARAARVIRTSGFAKDESRPASARKAAANPFASWFGTQKRARRGHRG